MVSDAKRFARRRPLAFIGTSLVAGILVGRVLRNADTSALTDAAKPTDDGDGADQRALAGSPTGTAAPPQATILAPTVGAGTS